MRADELWANYALKSEFTRNDAMAFFPGTVLAQLHGLLGDIRQVMSVMAVVTQILVTAGVLAGLLVLSRLFARALALLRAARRFDPERGAFERYAVVSVVGELKKYMRRTGWSAHVPRRVQEYALAVQSSIDRLTVELGRAPLLSEVADDCRYSAEQVSEALRARTGRYAGGDVTLVRETAVDGTDGCVDGLRHARLPCAIAPRPHSHLRAASRPTPMCRGCWDHSTGRKV